MTEPHVSPQHRRKMPILLGLLLALVMVGGLRLTIGTSSVGWPDGSIGHAAQRLLLRHPAATLCHTIASWLPEASARPWEARGRALTGQEPVTVAEIRLLRLLSGLAVGASLAISGVALQALLRNPLAEPFLLGLSSGAAVGIMLQMLLAYMLGVMLGGYHVGAMLGAAACMGIVYLASRRHGTLDPLGLLLTGVVLSSVNGAIIMFFQYIVGPGGLREDLARWMMGYIDEGVGASASVTMLLLTAALLGWLCWRGRAMDIASLSATEAASLGVHLPRLRTLLFVSASVLAAGAVVLAGPIAFVGLICPHFARLMLGPSHRALLPASAILGAMLVIAADTLSAWLALRFQFGMMPIGIFTAVIGGPAFLIMLRPQLGRGME